MLAFHSPYPYSQSCRGRGGRGGNRSVKGKGESGDEENEEGDDDKRSGMASGEATSLNSFLNDNIFYKLVKGSRFPNGLNTRFGLYKEGEETWNDCVVEETKLQRITRQIKNGHQIIVAISNLPDPAPYERTYLCLGRTTRETRDHLNYAKMWLNYALCSIPDENDEKYIGDMDRPGLYENDLDELWEKTRRMQPDGFPFSFQIMDARAYEKVLFSGYKGPIYWNHCQRELLIDWEQPAENFEPGRRLFFSMLKPIKIKDVGDEPLTVKGLCEAVAKLDYYPGDHRFLEEVRVELRKIDGVEAITIIFKCGS